MGQIKLIGPIVSLLKSQFSDMKSTTIWEHSNWQVMVASVNSVPAQLLHWYLDWREIWTLNISSAFKVPSGSGGIGDSFLQWPFWPFVLFWETYPSWAPGWHTYFYFERSIGKRACTQGSKDELRVKSEIVGYSAVCGWNSKKLKPCKTELLFCLCRGFKWGTSMSLGEQATFLCNIGVGQTSCLMWQGNRDSENCYTLISSWKQCPCFWCDLKRNLYPLFFLEAMCTGSKLEEAENSWCC